MVSALVLDGRSVRLRGITASDAPAILAVLQDATVARWWGKYDAARVAEEILEDDDVVVFAVEAEGAFAGIIQYGEELDPMYRHASIDLALAEAFQGRALGPDAIRALARYLLHERGHHRLIIDPAAANENAIRAYESVGFRRVGLMRQYELAPDGAWRDGLLMDMLAGELRD
ncbi:MAG: GNAT family N-acetyltransferase [Chloroflexota bacterium]